uniref:protein phosphatase methylesterase-1 n=1 Tax=Erpetoichthys calabaricus TaxID=27687 RepID=A0A8C4X3S2_ERPCA
MPKPRISCELHMCSLNFFNYFCFTFDSHGVGRKRDYSPVSWSDILDCDHIFRVYKSGVDGPVLVLLHGGGHSALSWAVFTASMTSRVTCRVLAMDLRGHVLKPVPLSLSATPLKCFFLFFRDVANVVKAIYGEIPPPLLLVGHSVGGAIAIHTASANLIPSVVGLVVIDVVEGSAMDVLHSMQNFLRGRPKSFKSIDHAIEWSVKSGQIRNLESAKVSMVGQVRRYVVSVLSLVSPLWGLGLEEQRLDGVEGAREPKRLSVYSWRIDLSKAEKYWDGWFRGISNLFLSCNVPKLLLLAVSNASFCFVPGKFMMQVLPPCGHAVHEDTPDKVIVFVPLLCSLCFVSAAPRGGATCPSSL